MRIDLKTDVTSRVWISSIDLCINSRGWHFIICVPTNFSCVLSWLHLRSTSLLRDVIEQAFRLPAFLTFLQMLMFVRRLAALMWKLTRKVPLRHRLASWIRNTLSVCKSRLCAHQMTLQRSENILYLFTPAVLRVYRDALHFPRNRSLVVCPVSFAFTPYPCLLYFVS